jgi:hypothetical protein
MGLRGNLTCGEILEQLVHANVRTRVRNIVFMGMGEPLNNYEQVGRGEMRKGRGGGRPASALVTCWCITWGTSHDAGVPPLLQQHSMVAQ